MSDGMISKNLRTVMYIYIIIEGITGLNLLFYQKAVEMIYGAKLLDPDVGRLFGGLLFAVAYLTFLGIKSNSIAVLTPIMKGLLLFSILSLGIVFYSFMWSTPYPTQVYITIGALHMTLTILLLYGFMLIKK
jgi:hypothetical protein